MSTAESTLIPNYTPSARLSHSSDPVACHFLLIPHSFSSHPDDYVTIRSAKSKFRLVTAAASKGAEKRFHVSGVGAP